MTHQQPSSELTDPSNGGAPSPPLPQHAHPPPSLDQHNHHSAASPSDVSTSPDTKWRQQLELSDTNQQALPNMNTCATNFTPKPTYADTVKASLPRPNGSTNGQTPPTRQGLGRGSQPETQRKGPSSARPQAGYSINHHRHTSSTGPGPVGGNRVDHPAQHHPPASNGAPNPIIRVSCAEDSAPRPIYPSQHGHYLHTGQEYRPSVFHTEAAYNMYNHTTAPEPLPFVPNRCYFQNPLHPTYHYHPPPVQEVPYHDPNMFGYASRPTSAYAMAGPFAPPPVPVNMAPSPMQVPSPMQGPILPYFYPPPALMPYPAPYTHPAYPIMPTPYAPVAPSPGPPARPGPDRQSAYSRPSSLQAGQHGGRQSRAETRSTDSSQAGPHLIPGRQSSNASRSSSCRTQPTSRPEPSLRAEKSAQPHLPSDIPANGSAAAPDRGRPRYRIVSTTASSVQSSRHDQSQGLLGRAGHEASSGPNGSALTRLPADNVSVSRRRRSVSTQRPQQEHLGQGIDRLPGGENEPPVNAPTAPASLRRLAHAAKAQKTSLPHKPSETGLWSQSKRWVSQETKERAAFQKLMQTLHYMGADKSPFVPQTPAALTAFRVAQTERKSRRLSEELNRKMLQLARRKRADAQRAPGNLLMPVLFEGKALGDGLSPVFASDTCFNMDIPCALQVEWPSLAELKEEGEKRAARYGRYFPLPRLNFVAGRILQLEKAKAYNADGSSHWEKKAVKHASRFIRPVTCELELDSSPLPQLQTHELPAFLQALLDEISETSSEDHEHLNEGET